MLSQIEKKQVTIETPTNILNFLEDRQHLTGESPQDFIQKATIYLVFHEIEEHITIKSRDPYGLKQIFAAQDQKDNASKDI